MRTEENKYTGEQRKIYVENTKFSTSTHSEKIDDITSWHEVKNLVKKVVLGNDEQVDFILWNSGFSSGITISSPKENIAIFNKCDFKTVKNLFIRDLTEEQVDKLTILRTKDNYQAIYKTNDTAMIKNYIYEPCDLNNLSSFLEKVADLAMPEKEHSNINGGLAFISNRGLKGVKGFVKYKGNRKRTYRNFIK